jgi:hypothetical protein
LEEHYRSPVDTEFTLSVKDPYSAQPEVEFCLLQCRPQSHIKERKARFPTSLNPADIIFSTHRIVPDGQVDGIYYVLFIPPEGYFSIASQSQRIELVRAINQINARLECDCFITVGPGRWGTSNPELGVPIGYGDIYHTRALVELSGMGIGPAPEPSFGAHFFQDLLEANIYPLAVFLDDQDAVFNHDFFYKSANHLTEILPEAGKLSESLRLIEVESYRPGHHIELVMDDERGQAVAYLKPNP